MQPSIICGEARGWTVTKSAIAVIWRESFCVQHINMCNLNYKIPEHIHVFFHNLRGYVCHHLIRGLGEYNDKEISCIAMTSGRYVSFSLGSLRFVDMFQFLNQSLDTVVDNLFKVGSDFHVRQRSDEHIDLLVRKVVYSYEYIHSSPGSAWPWTLNQPVDEIV